MRLFKNALQLEYRLMFTKGHRFHQSAVVMIDMVN